MRIPDELRDKYIEAAKFALNSEAGSLVIHGIRYNEDKDKYKVSVFDDGWYTVKLNGSFIRSCFKWIEEGRSTKWKN
jgi:hypothetical protein